MYDLSQKHSTAKFVIPVVIENLLATFVSLFSSWMVGGVSQSSLMTISQGNQFVSLISAAAAMLTTGSAILCARLLGAKEQDEASDVVEQTLLIGVLAGAVITALCLIFTTPLVKLLMHNADSAVITEGVRFFRMILSSIPFLLINGIIGGALRSSGDGHSPLAISLITYVVQILTSWLFIRTMRLEIIGSGLSYIVSRLAGTVLAVILLKRSGAFVIRLKRLCRLRTQTVNRIVRVGLPTSVESIFVQIGYVVANSMIIGLGITQSNIFSVANTFYTFASVVQSIMIPIAMTLVGQLIGAKEYRKARSTGVRIFAIGMTLSLVLTGLIWIFDRQLVPLYSAIPEIQEGAVNCMWAVFLMTIPAVALNTIDPQLRSGGDVRYVMISTVIAVWAIRLPLTYLFCYRMGVGATGVFLANFISLSFRAVLNVARYIKGKYLYMKV